MSIDEILALIPDSEKRVINGEPCLSSKGVKMLCKLKQESTPGGCMIASNLAAVVDCMVAEQKGGLN